MSEHYSVEYELKLQDGKTVRYSVTIDKETMISAIDDSVPPPDWAKLGHKQCEQCPLTDSEYCPVAIRLAAPMRAFNGLLSHAKTNTTVKTTDRTYQKETDVQDALRSLFGLIIATSGCPVTRPFRHMARYHLPFSSLEETVARITAAYLMRQLALHPGDAAIPVDFKELEALYNTMQTLNERMAKRLRTVSEGDGALNAVVILSTMSSLVPMSVQSELEKMRQWM